MRSFIYSFLFSATCMLTADQAEAQKKQTIYYPNGKVAFEGRFQLAWSQSEAFENRIATDVAPGLDTNLDPDERIRSLSFYKDLIPARLYEGKCRYYYPDGQLFAEGNYKSGFKNGTFRFFHPGGKPGAQQSYEWGMASGHWQSWDEQGRLTQSFHYLPIPENMLQQIDAEKIFSNKDNVGIDLKLFFGQEYEDFFDNSKREFRNHERNLDVLKQYVIKRLYHKAIKEGAFKVWVQGKPYLDMQFSNNIPVGTWTLYKDDKPAFEIAFKDGKIITANDFLNPDNNFGSPEYLAREKEANRRILSEDVNAVDPGIAPKKEIFRAVQQMPQAGYNVTDYIRKHLEVPKEDSEFTGRIMVQFVVREDGSIDKAELLRTNGASGALCDALLKVMQSMPKWKPGRQNGQAVAVYFYLPVDIIPE